MWHIWISSLKTYFLSRSLIAMMTREATSPRWSSWQTLEHLWFSMKKQRMTRSSLELPVTSPQKFSWKKSSLHNQMYTQSVLSYMLCYLDVCHLEAKMFVKSWNSRLRDSGSLTRVLTRCHRVHVTLSPRAWRLIILNAQLLCSCCVTNGCRRLMLVVTSPTARPISRSILPNCALRQASLQW